MIDDLTGLLLWGLKDQRKLTGLRTLQQVMGLSSPAIKKTRQPVQRSAKVVDPNSIPLSKNQAFLKQHTAKEKHRGLDILHTAAEELPIEQLLLGLYYLKEATTFVPKPVPRSPASQHCPIAKDQVTRIKLGPLRKIEQAHRKRHLESINLLLDCNQPVRRSVQGLRRIHHRNHASDKAPVSKRPPKEESNILMLSSNSIGNPGKQLSYNQTEARLLHTVNNLTSSLGKPEFSISRSLGSTKRTLTSAQSTKLSVIERSYFPNSSLKTAYSC
eukprot:TRINITY_DN10477_c1_g1_i1.p1 TRINITY_DN10477_c1_g1~~TRINITY_DN10477_c1_g1_i1.p1  ORF type:complete len:272 (+),score=39.09 TRINITY_DN10477_c1_g1_i1:72-887(+)